MTDLATLRQEYVERLERAVLELPERLSRLPEVERAVIFRSFARGRRDLGTDLDLLLVMETDEPFPERLARLHGKLGLGVDMDIVAYTRDELERMRDRPSVRGALEEGEVIYERASG